MQKRNIHPSLRSSSPVNLNLHRSRRHHKGRGAGQHRRTCEKKKRKGSSEAVAPLPLSLLQPGGDLGVGRCVSVGRQREVDLGRMEQKSTARGGELRGEGSSATEGITAESRPAEGDEAG
jgi:hypothetical protein